MANPDPTSPDRDRYQIRVRGRLDARWSAWFEGHLVVAQPDGTTVIEADLLDQAALHGLIRLIRDAGVALISVTRIDPSPDATREEPDAPHSTPAR